MFSSVTHPWSYFQIVDLETLYSKASKSAIYVKESEDLSTKLSAVKVNFVP